MQGGLFIILTVLLPAAAVPVLLAIKSQTARKVAVTAISFAMIVNAVFLAAATLGNGGLQVPAERFEWVSAVVTVIDVLVLVAILYYGFRLKEWKIIVPSLFQACALFYIEVIKRPAEPALLVNIDNLGLVLVLISSILGPLIAIFALGYMEKHEQHKKAGKSHVNRFFSVIFLFLFAMNAICITDNLLHLYAFWEITTLCSFLLIGYDGNSSSVESAKRALWLNSVGGLFFIFGVAAIGFAGGSLQISALIGSAPAAVVLVGVMLICCAGFVKSAQMPFQPWLLGAMVAPTPVSALLHSSTMVKAGVYIVIRLSPLFGGKLPGIMVAMVGAFTFMAASALAISQSNGKRVLAYSTIANLGLIICCAGIGGAEALSAAVLLMIYHAVSKALLFLCMGTVEQKIGSRNIEDMFGIFSKMPYTASIMSLGMISMMLPPFGVLVTKWLAIEAAARLPLVLILIILGSAFTIVFWVKWLGAVLTVYRTGKTHMEKIPFSMAFVLGAVGAMIPVLTAILPVVNDIIVNPAVSQLLRLGSKVSGEAGGIVVHSGGMITGAFSGILILLGVLCLLFILYRIISKADKPRIIAPYACGELANKNIKGRDFIGPMDKVEQIRMHNYYFAGLFDEKKFSPICSFISILLILVMFGVS